jgi:hypothetical protein
MAAERDQLGEIYEIPSFDDLPHRVKKWMEGIERAWIHECGLNPTSNENNVAF